MTRFFIHDIILITSSHLERGIKRETILINTSLKSCWGWCVIWKFINHTCCCCCWFISDSYIQITFENSFLIYAHAKHVTVITILKWFSAAWRVSLRWLDRHFRYRRTFPFKSLKFMTIRLIALHAEWLIRIHCEELIDMWQCPINRFVVVRSSLFKVNLLMVLTAIKYSAKIFIFHWYSNSLLHELKIVSECLLWHSTFT